MATKKTATKNKSAADIKWTIAAIEKVIAEQKNKRENSDETFVSLSRELEKKLKRANSPIIVWQSWSNAAPIGGTINYTVGVTNPDPMSWDNLVVAAPSETETRS